MTGVIYRTLAAELGETWASWSQGGRDRMARAIAAVAYHHLAATPEGLAELEVLLDGHVAQAIAAGRPYSAPVAAYLAAAKAGQAVAP